MLPARHGACRPSETGAHARRGVDCARGDAPPARRRTDGFPRGLPPGPTPHPSAIAGDSRRACTAGRSVRRIFATMLKKIIVMLPGDGIGPEVIRAAAGILRECAHEFGHHFDLPEYPLGGAAIDAKGVPLPAETLEACQKANAVLLGAVGGPRWDAQPVGNRPESGLLALRQELGLYVNVRPVRLHQPLRAISPLKHDRLGGVDIEIVRELAGGMDFGERGSQQVSGGEWVVGTGSNPTPEDGHNAPVAFDGAVKGP